MLFRDIRIGSNFVVNGKVYQKIQELKTVDELRGWAAVFNCFYQNNFEQTSKDEYVPPRFELSLCCDETEVEPYFPDTENALVSANLYPDQKIDDIDSQAESLGIHAAIQRDIDNDMMDFDRKAFEQPLTDAEHDAIYEHNIGNCACGRDRSDCDCP